MSDDDTESSGLEVVRCGSAASHLYEAEAVWRQRLTCTRLCDDRDSPVQGRGCVETESHLYEAV